MKLAMGNGVEAFKENEVYPLVIILQRDSAGDCTYYTQFQNWYYRKDDANSELMLRNLAEKKQLVIARISVVHKRQGFGTEIIKEVEKLARKKGYKSVLIESVLSDEMWNLGFKLGYTKYKEYNLIKYLAD